MYYSQTMLGVKPAQASADLSALIYIFINTVFSYMVGCTCHHWKNISRAVCALHDILLADLPTLMYLLYQPVCWMELICICLLLHNCLRARSATRGCESHPRGWESQPITSHVFSQVLVFQPKYGNRDLQPRLLSRPLLTHASAFPCKVGSACYHCTKQFSVTYFSSSMSGTMLIQSVQHWLTYQYRRI